MNDDILKGQWRQVRGNVRETFGKLTDDDLEQIGGNAETLLGKIQERYGYTREQASREWDKFWSDFTARTDKTVARVDRTFSGSNH